VYNHYFHTFLNPVDLIWSLLIVVVTGTVVMLIHTTTATPHPEGLRVARPLAGRWRTSLVVTIFVLLFATLGHLRPQRKLPPVGRIAA